MVLGMDGALLRGVIWLATSNSTAAIPAGCPPATWWSPTGGCPTFVDTNDAGVGFSLADVMAEASAIAAMGTPAALDYVLPFMPWFPTAFPKARSFATPLQKHCDTFAAP